MDKTKKKTVPKELLELYEMALDVIIQDNKVSTSFLQRRLKIGYHRAADLIDVLEKRGVIGPPITGGSKREILIPVSVHREHEEEQEVKEAKAGIVFKKLDQLNKNKENKSKQPKQQKPFNEWDQKCAEIKKLRTALFEIIDCGNLQKVETIAREALEID